jgi:multisubunit Na+/H+ antiporter MnhG subunit
VAMRDPYQRLHYVAPPATLGAFLVAAGVLAEGADLTAGLKSLVVLALLAAQAGVLAHATARAIFVHQNGGWPPRPKHPGAPPRAGGADR